MFLFPAKSDHFWLSQSNNGDQVNRRFVVLLALEVVEKNNKQLQNIRG